MPPPALIRVKLQKKRKSTFCGLVCPKTNTFSFHRPEDICIYMDFVILTKRLEIERIFFIKSKTMKVLFNLVTFDALLLKHDIQIK